MHLAVPWVTRSSERSDKPTLSASIQSSVLMKSSRSSLGSLVGLVVNQAQMKAPVLLPRVMAEA